MAKIINLPQGAMHPIAVIDAERNLSKHNNFIRGKYDDILNGTQQKFIYKLIEKIQFSKQQSRMIELEFVTFYKEFDSIVGKNFTQNDFIKLIETVQGKLIRVIGDDGTYVRTTWYTIHGRIGDKSRVTLEISEYIFKYIQNFQNNFTQIRLETLYSFKGFSAMRIYELMMQWKNSEHRAVSYRLDDLKELLGVANKKSYDKFTNFLNRIIKPALEEINRKSEINVDYDPIKFGRTVIGITFTFSEKVENEEQLSSNKPNLDSDGFFIPDQINISVKYRAVLEKDFELVDFSVRENFEAIIAAEEITYEKTKTKKISARNYKYFETVLTKKLMKIHLDRLEFEKQLNKRPTYKDAVAATSEVSSTLDSLLQQEDVAQVDVVQEEIVQEEIVQVHVVQEEIVQVDVVQEEIVQVDVVQEEIVQVDVVQEEIVQVDVAEEDVKEIEPIPNNESIENNIFFKLLTDEQKMKYFTLTLKNKDLTLQQFVAEYC